MTTAWFEVERTEDTRDAAAATWPPEAPAARVRSSAPPDPSQATTIHPGSVHDPSKAGDLLTSTHLRFALVEQRLAIISERLELLGARLGRQAEHSSPASPEALPGPFRDSNLVGSVPLEQPEERVEPIAPRDAPDVRAHDPIGAGGTLRPPKVPRELRFSAEAPPPARSGIKSTRNASAGPIMSGTVSGLSLGSLFSLFEFERSGGALSLRSDDQRVDLVLREGSVARCELDGVRVPAVHGVRAAFGWQSCSFTFRRDDVEEMDEAPPSVNAVMLDALRFHDEARRVG